MGEQRRQVGQGAEVGGDRHLRLAHREDGVGWAADVKGRDVVGAGADAASVHRRDDRHRAVGDGTDRRLEPHQVEEELNEPLVVVGAGPGCKFRWRWCLAAGSSRWPRPWTDASSSSGFAVPVSCPPAPTCVEWVGEAYPRLALEDDRRSPACSVFCHEPRGLHPRFDGFFVALFGPTGRSLAAPAHLLQDPPDVGSTRV
jgi:hypothetical protein